MSLRQIIVKVARVLGQNPNNTNEREFMLTLINDAATEIWEATDHENSLMECVIPILPNAMVALPYFVDSVRAMREQALRIPWDKTDLRPRYQTGSWDDAWRKWRDRGIVPIMQSITTAVPLVVRVAAIESSPPVISVTGRTANKANTYDSITPSSSWTASGGYYYGTMVEPFIEVTSIVKDKISVYDYAIMDASSGNVLAELNNNMLSTSYRLFDISEYPFGGDCPTDYTKRLMEVLYKPRLRQLHNDTDEFMLPGFDDALADKAISLYYELAENGAERAILYDQKAARTMMRRNDHVSGGKKMKIDFEPHAHDEVFNSIERRYVRYRR